MTNYEYILTVHWAHFGPLEYPFYNFHAALESAKSLLKVPNVSYVTLKRKPVNKPTTQEAFYAWEILHREGRILMEPETRLKELGLAWFALQCYDPHCPDCPSQEQCFKILAEMAELRRKLRSTNV